MKNQRDKNVIDHWLRLYNQLKGASYRVLEWPDDDSSKKNIDAFCVDGQEHTLAIEHTLIEPFVGEIADAARFLRTLGALENHPSLLQPGHMFMVSQPVASVPAGIRCGDIPNELLEQLPSILRELPDGNSRIPLKAGGCEILLHIQKLPWRQNDSGKFLTGRNYPGDPGPELVIRAMRNKIPKLSVSNAEKKILLLEKDAVAGTIESQFEQIAADHEVRNLLLSIDEIWSANTAGLEREAVLFTNLLWPQLDRATICSLNIRTGRFWRLEEEFV
jgi:hypothetical protein